MRNRSSVAWCRPTTISTGASGSANCAWRGAAALAVGLVAMLAAFAATTPAMAAGCPNAALRTGASAMLPDCRAYELVSPPDKGVGEVTSNLQFAPSVSGDRIVFQSFQAFPGAVSAGVLTDYMARRGPQGWTTTSISPPVPADFQASSYYQGFSDDLTQGVLNAWPVRAPMAPLTPDTPAGRTNDLYVGDIDAGTYSLLGRALPTPMPSPPAGWIRYEGASRDFSHVIFSAEGVALTPDADPTARNLYEWVNGQIRLASVMPGSPGLAAPGAEAAGSGLEVSERAISDDGSRIFFQLTGGSASTGVYVRTDGTTTTQIGDAAAYFLSAKKDDGSKVLFADATTCGLCIEDLDTGATTKLDVDGDLTDGTSPLLGVVAVSDDLSRVYFGSLGRLTPDEGAAGPLSPDQPNLYLWDRGTLRFIAHFDAPSLTDQSLLFNAQSAGYQGGLIARSERADVTPDGRRLVFTAISQVTGFDNASTSCDASGAPRCTEVFVYDEQANGGAGALTCASCGLNGVTGDSTTMGPKGTYQKIDQTNISGDGQHVFFESAEALVPDDTNGKVDVYEYDVASHAVHLISSGHATSDARYAGASKDGSVVFFTTRERLVGQDLDDAADLYAAHVDGGFPAPPSPVEPCEGEGCQGPLGSPPATPPVASVAFSGSGNVTPDARSATRRPTVSKARVIRGATATIRVKVPGKGRIAVASPRLRRATRAAARSGTYRVRVRLSKLARRMLAHRPRVHVRMTVRFVPAHGESSRVRVRLTFAPRRMQRRAASASRQAARRAAATASRRVADLSSQLRKGR